MARGLRIGCALVVAGAFGCNSLAGINDPLDKGTAADGGTGQPVISVDRFLGRWTTSTGTREVTNCSLAQTLVDQESTLIVTQGAATGTIVVTPELIPSCQIRCSVQGDEATLLPDQTCVFPSDTDNETFTYLAPSTFKITSQDGTEAIAHISATILFDPPGTTCGFEETSQFTKEPPAP